MCIYCRYYIVVFVRLLFSTGRSLPSFGSHVVAEQPEAGRVQQRPGGVAVRRDRREKGQVPHQACRTRGE